MNAELIAVGTELLLGDTINTDAAAVARLLSELGINVYWQTVVGDNRARLEQAVQLARTRADLIITTGGLGPTCDDLTKEVVAGAFGIPLELNKAEEDRLRGEEPVEVKLFKDNGKYKDDVFVAVNGENCVIKRGERVQIKRKFAEVLDHSEHQDYETSLLIEQKTREGAKALSEM